MRAQGDTMSPEECRVLVLDGETRTALAVVRSLGACGYDVAVASHVRRPLAFYSRWRGLTFRCPSPLEQPDRYTHWLHRTVELWQPRVVLPITDVSLGLALEFEAELRQHTILPTIDRFVFEEVSDKARLAEVASSLGVVVPRTALISSVGFSPALLREKLNGMRFPVVIKPRRSAQRAANRVVKADVFYADSQSEVEEIIRTHFADTQEAVDFLVQERIHGVGVGVFALCVRGRPLAEFAHRRILEKPPSGGRSVLSESIAPSEAPMEAAHRLLAHYRWTGVAMVEFKRDAEGRHYLMEINPRLWGSLQLAIDAGRDFPRYLVELAQRSATAGVGEGFDDLPPYAVGIRLRWLLGTLDHALINMKQRPLRTLVEVFRENSLQCNFRGSSTRCDVCRLSDIKPFLMECWLYLLQLIGRGNE